MRLRTLAALALLVGLAGPTHAQTFSLTDLGAHTPAGASRSLGINKTGQVVGDAQDSTGNTKAFLWSAGTMKNLGTLKGYYYSVGTATNNRGDVVGWGQKTTTSPQSLMWLDGGAAQTVVALSGGRQSMAYGINDARQVVGSMTLTEGNHAFLSTVVAGKRKAVDLGPGTGLAINSSGQVLVWDGTQENNFSLWTPFQPNGATGSLFHLGAGGLGVQTGALNDQGQAVFGRWLWAPTAEPSIGLTAGLHDLGYLQPPGSARDFVSATGINQRGQVVGFQYAVTSWDANGNPATGELQPFLWDPQSGMRRVQVEPGGADGWVLVTPIGGAGLHTLSINDPLPGQTYGQIVCAGRNAGGSRRALLLKPLP